MERPLEITVGGPGPYDPAIGTTDCLIPAKKGIDLLIEKRTVGFLKVSETIPLTNGGFRLAAGTFQAGEVYNVFDSGVIYLSGASAYTNGYNYTKVMNALFSRIGWRQPTIAGAPVMNANNLSSRSGRYFGDFHVLNSPNLVKKLIEDPLATDDMINAYLEGLQKAAILRSLNGVFNDRELLETRTDFDRYREQNDRPINHVGTLFVGRRIRPARAMDISVQVDSVALYFESDITFPLYLFQEGKKAPIWNMDVTAIGGEKTLVVLPDVILSYLGSNNIGGAYFIGYFQSDLGAVRAMDETRIGYNIANCYSLEAIESKKVVGETNFDRVIIAGSPWTHGLNVEFSSFRDWTNGIVKKANLFDELIGLSLTVHIVELAVQNVRSNSEERDLKLQLQQLGLWQQLEGVAPGVPDGPKIVGLRDQIARELTRVKQSFYPYFKAINYPDSDHISSDTYLNRLLD